MPPYGKERPDHISGRIPQQDTGCPQDKPQGWLGGLVPQKPSPEDTQGGLNYAQMSEILSRSEKTLWESTGKISEVEDRYFGKPEPYRWYWKPPWITYGFGIPAVIFLLGQFGISWLDAHTGLGLGVNADMTRILMLLGGFCCLALCSPIYRPLDWKPQDDINNFIDKEDFRRRHGR